MGKNKKEKKGGFNVPGIFKKQPVEEQDGSSTGSTKSVASNTRKASPILHETVFETVAGICRKNKLFVVRRDDEDVYVGIYLNLDDIGGLSAKTKDESKGSMVSQINSGHISVMFNSDLDAQNGLIFIPTEDTIGHMMEYALLREDRTYALVLIDAHGEGDFEKTDVLVDLEFLEKCHAKKIHIKTKLGKYLEDVKIDGQPDLSSYGGQNKATSTVQQEDEDVVFDAGGEEPEEADFSGADMGGEDDGLFGDEPFGEGYEGEYGSGPTEYDAGGYGSGEYEGGYGDGYGGEGEADGYGEEDGEGEEEVEIDYTMSRQAVSRRFFNDDLAIELDTAGLDAALSGYMEFRPIPLRPEGAWLSDVINPLIVTANQELFDLHKQHLGDVQVTYLNGLESAYLAQMSKLSSPEIKAKLLQFQSEYDKNKSEALPKLLAERQAAAKADWEKRVKDYGEAARVAAEQSYKSKYQQQFDEAYASIEADLQRTLDTEFASTRGAYLTEQKAVLYQALDVQNAELIQNAIEEYKALIPAELALLKHHQEVIAEQVAQRREEEMSRIRVLDDELSRDTQIAALTAQYNEKVASVSTDFEARIAGLQSDMDQQASRYQSELAAKDRAMAELREQYSNDREDWNSRTNEFLTKLREADEAKEREVKIRVDEMRAERDSYSEKYEHLQKTQKHGYMMMIAIAVVACIAALCIGMLAGSVFFGGDKKSGDKAPDALPAYSDTNPDEQPASALPENPGDGQAGADENPAVEPAGDPVPAEPDAAVQPEQGDGISDTDWANLQDPVL